MLENLKILSNRPEDAMDPLTDVLSLMRPQNHMSAGFRAGGPWAIAFPAVSGTIKCGAVVCGGCWLSVEDGGRPVCLGAGEGFVLPQGRPFRLASDLDLDPVPAAAVFPTARRGGIAEHGQGEDCFLVSSRFVLEGPNADFLLSLLPPLIHIGNGAEWQSLRWSVERMMAELGDERPGSELIIRQLAHMILVQALRAYLETEKGNAGGWLAALSDRQIGAAIRAIHADPGRRFTIADLASVAGMSRSTFALRFKEKVGQAPMEYLTAWRMILAAERMQSSNAPLSAIAADLGYESESAFSKAFRRVMAVPPRQFVRMAATV